MHAHLSKNVYGFNTRYGQILQVRNKLPQFRLVIARVERSHAVKEV